MSIDLNFWKCSPGVTLDPQTVYRTACCEGNAMGGLERLPTGAIMADIGAAFPGWTRMDGSTWEEENGGSFQLLASLCAVRVDCYGMNLEEMARFSQVMRKHGCPLYDPQLGCRFDTLSLTLYGEAEVTRETVEADAGPLFPGLTVGKARCLPPPEESVPLPQPEHPELEVFVHRGETVTKVAVNLYFGSRWTSRPTQCRTDLLTGEDEAREQLSKLARAAMARAAEDMRRCSYYR